MLRQQRGYAALVIVLIIATLAVFATIEDDTSYRVRFEERCRAAGGKVVKIEDNNQCVKIIEYITINANK